MYGLCKGSFYCPTSELRAVSNGQVSVWLVDLLGSFHSKASLGDVTWVCVFVRCPFWLVELWLRLEAFGDNLVECLSIEDMLTPRVVGGTESAKPLHEIAVRVDGDAHHLTRDLAIETFDHADIRHEGGGALKLG